MSRLTLISFAAAPRFAHNRVTQAQQGWSGALVVSFPYPFPKPHTGPHKGEFVFSPQNEFTPPPKGGGVGYHLSWVGRAGSARSKLAHTVSTGRETGFGGVVHLPGSQNRTQVLTGPSFVSVSFSGALLLRQSCQLPLHVVIHCFLDGQDGKLQRTISHLTSLSPHLSGFYVDEPFLL